MIFGIHVVSATVNVPSSLRHKLTALNWLMHSAAHGYTFLTASDTLSIHAAIYISCGFPCLHVCLSVCLCVRTYHVCRITSLHYCTMPLAQWKFAGPFRPRYVKLAWFYVA